MVLPRNTSFQNLETQVKEGFEEFWSQSKVRFTGFCDNVQCISNNIIHNITYIFNHKFTNKTTENTDRNSPQLGRDIPYHIRHSMVINELKNRELDNEWETLGNM